MTLPHNLHLQKLSLEINLAAGESISCISTYDANLYLGTSQGQILHYYNFDDAEEYIPILQLPVTDKPVVKILVVPDIQMCLALSDRVLHPYTLPELSPCLKGKIKDVNDVLRLSQVKNPKVKNKHDKIIVYTSSKIRLVQLLPETVKLLRDIPYPNALIGLSSAAGTLANYSNISLVANETNYDVVDLQQTRRISLFEYNSDTFKVTPHIVPFAPLDKPGEEEYLLTIASDAQTSMAMFINSLGDVTRGTLTWIDQGYPTNGVVVEWPNVIGLFLKEDKLHLTFSSLDALEVVYSTELAPYVSEEVEKGNYEHMKITKVENGLIYVHKELKEAMKLVSLQDPCDTTVSERQLRQSFVVLFEQQSIYFLSKDERVVTLTKKVLDAENRKEALLEVYEELKEEQGAFGANMYSVALLVSDQTDKLKTYLQSCELYDPRVLLYCLEGYSETESECFTKCYVENALYEIIDYFKGSVSNKEFESWLIKEVYQDGAAFAYVRVLLYKKIDRTNEQVIELVDSERALWQAQSPSNDQILAFLKDDHQFFVELHILQLQLDEKKSNAMPIIDLGLALLSKTVSDKEVPIPESAIVEMGRHKFDLVLIVFHQLRTNVEDSEDYTKKLLELLKLHPQRGLELLEANKGGRHKSSHRYILDELSKSHALSSSFSTLKMDFIEQSFIEALDNGVDHGLVDELLLEMLQYLQNNADSLHDEFVNLQILVATFRVEDTLRDNQWPKLMWVEFLHIHGRQSECKSLCELYLKLYELMVIKSLFGSDLPQILELSDNEAMQYLQQIFHRDQNELIKYLLDNGDYSAAEWVAMYGKMPLPRKTIFTGLGDKIRQSYVLRAPEDIKDSVRLVIRNYLQTKDEVARHGSVRHLIDLFGRKYFTPTEILELLPSDFPVVDVCEYLSSVMVDLEADKTDSVLIKVMTKLDAKFTEKVYKDFEATHKEILEDAT